MTDTADTAKENHAGENRAEENRPFARAGGKGDLTRGPVGAHLARLGTPMLFGILAMVSFQLADTWYVSRLGLHHLAAISLTMPVAMALFSLFIGVGIAVSSVVSRRIGEGRHGCARRIVTHGLLLAFGFGLALTLLGLAFMNPLLRAMGADGTTLPLAADYMKIWFWGNLFIAVPVAGNAAMRAAGDSFTPAAVYCAAAVLNVVIDPLLIFGLGPFPRLEMEGAAIGTVLSNACAMAAVLYVMHVRRKMLLRGGLRLREFGESAKSIAFIALPAGLTGMVAPAVNGFVLSLLAGGGAAAQAAFGVASRVEAFAFVVLMALATGMGPVLGQNWGARHFGRVRRTLTAAFAFMICWSALVAVFLYAGGRAVAQGFSSDAAVVAAAVLYFRTVPFSYPFGNVATGWSSAFNALGLPIHGLGLILLRSLALTVPLAWAGERYFGYPGVFLALALANVLSGVAAHIWGMRVAKARGNGLKDAAGG